MPTDPRDWTVYNAVADALQLIDGTGDYHTDVSARLGRGTYPVDRPPFAPPCVALGYLELSVADGPELGGARHELQLIVQGWAAGATSTSAEALMYAASKLRADVSRALKAQRTTDSDSALYTVETLSQSWNVVDARQLGVSLGAGYCACTITATYTVYNSESE